MRRSTIAPTDQERLVDHICGARRVGPGAQVPDAGAGTGGAQVVTAIGVAVVGHHALDQDALALEPAQRADQEAGDRLALLVRQDLDVRQARGIVYSDVDELPARAVRAVAAVAGDPVADAAEAGELLDIEVDEFAGACAAVTPRRLARLECRRRWPATVLLGRRRRTAISSPVMRYSRRRRVIMASQGAGSLLATRRGAEPRFSRPARPAWRKRASHLRTVRVLTSKLAATALTLQPSWSTRRIITARPNGVVRAFLWAFIRVVPRQLAMGRTNHLPGLSPDEQRPQTAHLGRGMPLPVERTRGHPQCYCDSDVSKLALERLGRAGRHLEPRGLMRLARGRAAKERPEVGHAPCARAGAEGPSGRSRHRGS
jgi:hypothetical protein